MTEFQWKPPRLVSNNTIHLPTIGVFPGEAITVFLSAITREDLPPPAEEGDAKDALEYLRTRGILLRVQPDGTPEIFVADGMVTPRIRNMSEMDDPVGGPVQGVIPIEGKE